MAAARGTPAKRTRKPAQRRHTATRTPPPATLNGDHVKGFVAGLLAGAVIGAAGMLWLTHDGAVDRPIPAHQEDALSEEPVRPRFDFFTELPEEDLNLAESAEFQPRAGDTAESTYQQYILQAGSFRRREDAERRKGELAFLGLESAVEESRGDNGLWYRVAIGPFNSRSEMMRARSLTAQADIDTLLLKRGNRD